MSAQSTSEDVQDAQENPDTENAETENAETEHAEGEGERENKDDDGSYFVVEKILEESVVEGVLMYKVRWENYGPQDDTFEPATELAHCTDILEAWKEEKRKRAAGEAKRKKKGRSRQRTRSVNSPDGESLSPRTIGEERTKKDDTKKRKRDEIESEEDAASDASGGTDDSFMNELKSKHEGTYKWEDVRRRSSKSVETTEEPQSDEDSLESLKNKEKKRRQAKKAATKSVIPSKRRKTPVPVPAKSTGRLAKEPPVPHFPFANRPLNAIKPAKRKPGTAQAAAPMDDRRPKFLSLSAQNAIKKKQAQEPPPDASKIAVFRPDAVLTANARNMRSGRGFNKAVGDIDTAISLVQKQQSAPIAEVKESKAILSSQAPPLQTSPPSRRSLAFAEALTNASKTMSTATQAQSTAISPIKASPTRSSIAGRQASPEQSPTSPTHLARRASIMSPIFQSRPSEHISLPRRHSTTEVPMFVDSSSTGYEPMMDILPALAEDNTRTWSGELLYSKDKVSLGTIRLLVPPMSTKIVTIPVSGTSLCLTKVVSTEYIGSKWLPAFNRRGKPEYLSLEFQDRDQQKFLADLLRNMDSAGLVLEETCTLLFFIKSNERLRPLLQTDSSSSPIGVAVLQPIKDAEAYTTPSPADDLLLVKHASYNGILLSEDLPREIPFDRQTRYVVFSPPESLETIEIERILASRGAHQAVAQKGQAGLVLIHRIYTPCFNYIPGLTDLKRLPGGTNIFLFGSYLDWEEVDDEVVQLYGFGCMKIFPGAGIICFTMDHILEDPHHIKSIIAYNKSRGGWRIALPSAMMKELELLEQTNRPDGQGDLAIATALLREHIAAKKVVLEDFPFNNFKLNSYLPFMNYLQNREFKTVRRFLLVHPRAPGAQWEVAGNGIEVYNKKNFDHHFKVTK